MNDAHESESTKIFLDLPTDASVRKNASCWKCRGTGKLVVKPSKVQKSNASNSHEESLEIVITVDDISKKVTKIYYQKCRICSNEGIELQSNLSPGKISTFTKFPNPTGPYSIGSIDDPFFYPNHGETLCALSGHWMIYQYSQGHKFTTDDVCTAHIAALEILHSLNKKNYEAKYSSEASEMTPSMENNKITNDNPRKNNHIRHLDLGTGLGSVLMMIRWRLNDIINCSVGIEAQIANISLAKRSIVFNGIKNCYLSLQDISSLNENDKGENSDLFLDSEYQTIGDDYMREQAMKSIFCSRDITSLSSSSPLRRNELLKKASFDLVTGTPPYFPLTNGAFPMEPGRGQCAFETRGGVEVYTKAAAAMLSDKLYARFVMCQTSIEIERTEKAACKKYTTIISVSFIVCFS